jgi:HSP20 family protein
MANELTEIVEKDDEVIVKADLPGIKPEEVKVEVADGMLTVSGEHEEKVEEEGEGYVRRERRHSSFLRSTSVPPEVKAEDVEISVEGGRVVVRVPKPKAS